MKTILASKEARASKLEFVIKVSFKNIKQLGANKSNT